MSGRDRRRHTATLVLATGTLLAVGLTGPGPSAAGAPQACWPGVSTDVDGAGPDVVVGMPSYDLPGKPDAGAVVVFSNVGIPDTATPQAPTARTLYTADDFTGLTAQKGARFGAAVSVWEDYGDDNDDDDCADLLVGAPGQNVGGQAGAGAVFQVRGTPNGLGPVHHVIDESSLLGPDTARAGDGFGAAIAAETVDALAIGVPGRDVDGHSDAGRVVRVDSWDLSIQKDPVVIEQGGRATGAPEAGDRFGEVLALSPTGWGSQLYVGAPHEDIGAEKDAGAVFLVPSKGKPSSVSQDTPGAGGAAEAGDRYGASIAPYWTFDAVEHLVGVVAAGVPGEDIGKTKDAGAVAFSTFLGPSDDRDAGSLRGAARVTTQDSTKIPGSVEAGDAFGTAVLQGTFGPGGEFTDLVTTAPLEDLGRAMDSGMLSVGKIESDGSPTPIVQQFGSWSQDSAGVAGAAESGDRFGAAVTGVKLAQEVAVDEEAWEQLVVTVPREDVSGVKDAGMAYIGMAPGKGSVALVPPSLQAGAGIGMVLMQLGQQ
jgi:hypothetical protein